MTPSNPPIVAAAKKKMKIIFPQDDDFDVHDVIVVVLAKRGSRSSSFVMTMMMMMMDVLRWSVVALVSLSLSLSRERSKTKEKFCDEILFVREKSGHWAFRVCYTLNIFFFCQASFFSFSPFFSLFFLSRSSSVRLKEHEDFKEEEEEEEEEGFHYSCC